VVGTPAAEGACPAPRAAPAYAAEVRKALLAKQDLWGNELLAAPGGPTYERARRYLAPLALARGRGQQPLTASGFHYVAFSQPAGPRGAQGVFLHVADGSQIVSRRIGGPALTVLVGPRGRERYGACLARLGGPALADGWLPILRTTYRDAVGTRYEQESFVARRDRLLSFVRLTVDARVTTRVRVGTASITVPRGTTRTLHVSWDARRVRSIAEESYLLARRSVEAYWPRRLAEGAEIDVPERRVNDALRNLLVQNLTQTWRYSIGNPYEQFSFPEGLDVAQVMGEYGFAAVERSIVRTSLTRRPTPYPSWKMGQKLLATASYYHRFRDRRHVAATTPTLRRYVEQLAGRLESSRGLLARERYSSDIPDQVYGLHGQAVAWQGLKAMAEVWQQTGRRALARRTRTLAARLETGLRRAVRASQRRLGDGSLFIPVRLLDRETPYAAVTASRAGSYWNLVAPYALASGLFEPGSPQATGALRYLLRHGSRLLGQVRAGAYSLYRDPVHPVSGTNHVYGTSVARFLAANDQADQLVLSLYGGLAAAMTPGTFVSGEAASVAPLDGGRYRAMYLPPNGASNAATLATLRLMLVHETADRRLRLAFATPRAWLEPGRRIVVRRVPTSFGPVSYTLEARDGSVHVSVDLPPRGRPRAVSLRIRLPQATRTIDLTGRSGRVEIVIRTS
jgi:hypothetical protein